MSTQTICLMRFSCDENLRTVSQTKHLVLDLVPRICIWFCWSVTYFTHLVCYLLVNNKLCAVDTSHDDWTIFMPCCLKLQWNIMQTTTFTDPQIVCAKALANQKI